MLYISFDNIIVAIYGIPSILIYVSMLLSLLSIRKTLNKSFTLIYFAAAVVNFVTIFQVWTTIRLVDDQWFFWYYEALNAVPALPTIQKFLNGYVQYVQMSITFLMTFDRFLAICHVRRFEIWQRWAPLCIFASLCAPLLLHATLHYTMTRHGSRFVYNSVLNGYSLSAYNFSNSNNSIIAQAAVGTACLIICAGLNIRSLARLRKLYIAHKRIEISFFAIAFFTFIAQAANVIVLLMLVYIYCIRYDASTAAIVREATAYTLDAISLGPGICTLLIRGPIRRKFFATIRSILVFFKCATPTIYEAKVTMFKVESSFR